MKKAFICLTWGFVLLFAMASVALCADSGALRVGAARVEFTKLTPAPATPPSGKYEHEKLFARAIVIDNGVTRAALISIDGAAPASIPAIVAAELKCPVENIISSGTHSHSAGLGGPPPGTPAAAAAAKVPPAAQPQTSPLDAVVLDAVRQAVKKLQPARMAFGSGLCYLNVNRDTINPKTRLWTQDANPKGPSDKTVAVLKFESPSGELIALYVNYAMHPVNLYLGGITSADYPGAACRYIEQIYEDKAVVAFSNGAEGDQNPLYLRASTAAMLRRGGGKYAGQPLVREAVESEIREGRKPMVPLDAKAADDVEKFIEAEGILFAEEVLRVAHSLEAEVSDVRIAGAQKTITCPGRTRTDKGREGQPGTYTDGPDVNIALGVLGIGNVALASVPAEVYNAIGQAFKAKSPMANSVFVGMANGRANSGYIPTDDAYGRTTFQVLGSRLKPGCAETSIADTLVELVSQYLNGASAVR
jgi:neutral ceramidase